LSEDKNLNDIFMTMFTEFDVRRRSEKTKQEIYSEGI